MRSTKSILRLSIGTAIISWLLLLAVDLLILFGTTNNLPTGIPREVQTLLLSTFLLSIFAYYKFKLDDLKKLDFTDLLWKVFVTGLIATVVSFIIRFFFFLLGSSSFSENILAINFFYHINLALIIVFLISTFTVFKRLIQYQKTKNLLLYWKVFEYSLLLSVFFAFFRYGIGDVPFYIALGILVAMGLFLSVNLKWVAYLNFKQKWKSILLLVLTILYLSYFLINLINYSNNYTLITNALNNVFILALFVFIFVYCLFSLLVILFNLPTSSVFEQKLEEVMTFQRLSQSIQVGQNEEEVYAILLDSSASTVFASAGWLELLGSNGDYDRKIKFNIEDDAVEEVKKAISRSKIKNLLDAKLFKISNPRKFATSLTGVEFKSVLVVPLLVKEEQIGRLILLKDVAEGFGKDMIDIVNTFASQACISIENFRLLNEALQNERYQEELKIAQKVQQSLLPLTMEEDPAFEIVTFTEAADEVGGDFYDTYRLDDDNVALIIGDVSGKGTSAAFNMAQMKGVYNSLVQLNLPPDDFLALANDALGRCLEKTSFITSSYYNIDTKNKEVKFARAGHCPTLYYDSSAGKSKYFETKGLGLGVLRGSGFHKHIELNKFRYNSGDIIVLYTDGITEGKNDDGEEFGYERLQEVLCENAQQTPQNLQKAIIDRLYEFTGKVDLNDDYTLVIVRFK